MNNFGFGEIVSALTHLRGGIPANRLSYRMRLGQHRSVFFGPSYDFYDIQEYDPERDPPNQVVQSFLGSDEEITYSRKCIEQREVKVVFLADVSSSIDTGPDLAKRRMLLETVGYVGLTGARYQDPVGLVGFADKILLNQPARCGQNNFFHLLRTLYDFVTEEGQKGKKALPRQTDFFGVLDFVKRTLNQPCFIPVVSDFIGFEKALSSSVLRTVASRHELLFIFLDDPAEVLAAKGPGFIRIEDAETGRQLILSRNKMTKLEAELRERRKNLRRELKGMGINSVVLEYGKHFQRLHRLFMRRHRFGFNSAI